MNYHIGKQTNCKFPGKNTSRVCVEQPHLNPALQQGLHNGIVLTGNNNSASNSLILALKDISFHSQ